MKARAAAGMFLVIAAVEILGAEGNAGGVEGQLRVYSMTEDNHDPLVDYRGTAVGGKILYRTPDWNNVQGVVGVYTTHFLHDNVSASRVEPLASGRGSRYVAGLVDTTDLDANNVTGIGEGYLHCRIEEGELMIGRMKLDTPFINPQDGRMIPTFVQGAWAKRTLGEGWLMQGGYINAFWNRNTPQWKSVEDSLGYGYEMGNSSLESAVRGDYKGNTSSNGVFIGNLRYHPSAEWRFEVWDYYVENIFNLGYAEMLAAHPIGDARLLMGGQIIHQYEVGEGGNGEDNLPDATDGQKAKSYLQKGEKSTTYGAKIAMEYDDSRVALAYNRTTDQGRFLFPREWGKEPLYTFQKRDRSDGSGDCDAWLVSLEHNFKRQGLAGFTLMAGYGEYRKSDPKEWRYNKYGTPSYAQWNIDLLYRFSGPLKGLRAEYLAVRKVARGETYQVQGPAEYNFIFRKNGMTLHNFMLNYDF